MSQFYTAVDQSMLEIKLSTNSAIWVLFGKQFLPITAPARNSIYLYMSKLVRYQLIIEIQCIINL